jgi:hypothetical protein
LSQYRYLLLPVPTAWSAQEADAALHVLEQIQTAIREAYPGALPRDIADPRKSPPLPSRKRRNAHRKANSRDAKKGNIK